MDALKRVLLELGAIKLELPYGIVGNAFSQVWNARDKLLLMQRMRDAFVQQGFGAKANIFTGGLLGSTIRL